MVRVVLPGFDCPIAHDLRSGCLNQGGGKKCGLFCHWIRDDLLSWHSADGSKFWVCLSCEHSMLCVLNLLTAWEPSHWVCTWKLCVCLCNGMIPDEDFRTWHQSSSCFGCGKPVKPMTLFHTATDSCRHRHSTHFLITWNL